MRGPPACGTLLWSGDGLVRSAFAYAPSFARGDSVNADEKIERLNKELRRFAQQYPGARGTLRITNTAFRSCTKEVWRAHNWILGDEEVRKILDGSREERKAAFLALLGPHNIDDLEVVPGVDIIEVVRSPDFRNEA